MLRRRGPQTTADWRRLGARRGALPMPCAALSCSLKFCRRPVALVVLAATAGEADATMQTRGRPEKSRMIEIRGESPSPFSSRSPSALTEPCVCFIGPRCKEFPASLRCPGRPPEPRAGPRCCFIASSSNQRAPALSSSLAQDRRLALPQRLALHALTLRQGSHCALRLPDSQLAGSRTRWTPLSASMPWPGDLRQRLNYARPSARVRRYLARQPARLHVLMPTSAALGPPRLMLDPAALRFERGARVLAKSRHKRLVLSFEAERLARTPQGTLRTALPRSARRCGDARSPSLHAPPRFRISCLVCSRLFFVHLSLLERIPIYSTIHPLKRPYTDTFTSNS